jgi:hypothetical protein
MSDDCVSAEVHAQRQQLAPTIVGREPSLGFSQPRRSTLRVCNIG